MKNILDMQSFTDNAFQDQAKEPENAELERAEYYEIIERNFFQLQRESQQIMKELPKRDEALRSYTEAIKSARPELHPEGAVQKRG